MPPLTEGEGRGEGETGFGSSGEFPTAEAAVPLTTAPASAERERNWQPETHLPSPILHLPFSSLDAFRPLTERAAEAPVAEAQRREFFAQLHRWLRQDYAVHVFCNNDGERQRFREIWKEYGFGDAGQASGVSPNEQRTSCLAQSCPTGVVGKRDDAEDGRDACPTLHLGALSRGFLCEQSKVVIVTDAEIFGRYKVQRPRRLKSPHAQAARSALDIDFTELEEGDYVVHLQHGIGKYLGLKVLPAGAGGRSAEEAGADGTAALLSQ